MKRIFCFSNVCIIAIMALLASCATSHQASHGAYNSNSQNSDANNALIIGDFISFGNDAKASYYDEKGKQKGPYELVTPNNPQHGDDQIFEMENIIKETEPEQNTAALYAMDMALDRIEYVRKHYRKGDPDTKYYIIFMTDGLDNISAQVAKKNNRGNYKTTEKYQKGIEKRIEKISGHKKKSKNQFEIYPIVFTGTDLGEIQNSVNSTKFKEFIDKNMGWMRGSSNGLDNAPQIIYENNFDTILNKFKNLFIASGFEFHIPKGYEGKEIEMSFWGTTTKPLTKNDTKRYETEHKRTKLTGKFIRKGNEYYLENVEFIKSRNKEGETFKLDISNKGKEGKNGFTLKAINNNDKKEVAVFRLENPKLSYINKKGTPVSYFIDKFFKLPTKNGKTIYGVEQRVKDDGISILNSEYESQAENNIDTYFILVLDVSKSLGNKLEEEKLKAIDMIGVITDGKVYMGEDNNNINNSQK